MSCVIVLMFFVLFPQLNHAWNNVINIGEKFSTHLSNVLNTASFTAILFLGFLNKTKLKRGGTAVSCAYFFKVSNQAEASISYRVNKPLLDPRQLNLRYTSQAPPIIIKHAVTPKHVKNTGKYSKPSGSNKLAPPSSLFSNSL